MLKTTGNPGGLPIDVFDGLREQPVTIDRSSISISRAAVLWIWPARREAITSGDLELVASGHDPQRQGSV